MMTNTRLSGSGVGESQAFGLRRSDAAFTMIEIAISLAIIGFALVAIIGILPTGMSVQRENREETIINQDMTVFMNALRNGERGFDDLTNYVMGITNTVAFYDADGNPPGIGRYEYTPTQSRFNGAVMTPSFPITNGLRIIGLLSTPKIIPLYNNNGIYLGFRSNYVVANVRALSGLATEKVPQDNALVRDLALSYRLITEVSPYGTNYFDPNWTNYQEQTLWTGATNWAEIYARSNQYTLVTNLQYMLHDVRLTFRWPLFPNGGAGNGRQTFRTLVGGSLLGTNEPAFQGPNNEPIWEYRLWFLRPSDYAKAP